MAYHQGETPETFLVRTVLGDSLHIYELLCGPYCFVFYIHGIKTVEYGLIIAFEVNMYYKINLDGDTAILLIRGGDWRLIFNCKSNYMGQIASDV